ncbi:terminase large subunit domain-containing protein [Martelella alba]|uniref:terminase large subunit domain-containing protein n=1 Tax=Martelella alba TaxID=2590451 RepID=UPI001E5CF2C5|nr:terminase family protein [Martelella alba]
MDIYLPELHAGEQAVWDEGLNHRNNVVRCGRRWGKTQMLGIIAVCYSTSSFEIKGKPVLSAGRVGIFTPEYRQYQEIFDYLTETLDPLIKSQSRSEKRILLKNGGKIDFWVTNDNPLAGRGREYDVVLIDEAAFSKSPEMLQKIWPLAIKPTLLTRRGRAWVFSTPNGIDEENFFYAICNDPQYGFFEHYAPTSANPYVPPEELAEEEKRCEPRVFRQEFLAMFVDWSKDALFDVSKWLVDGLPVEYPANCGGVFAVMDTAVKGGSEHDGSGIIYFAFENTFGAPRLTILDWDVVQIDGALLENYLPGVFTRLEELATQCQARNGSMGLFIEDASMGSILLQKGRNNGWPVIAIDSALTSKGKDERGVMSSGHHFLEKAKISRHAFEKTAVFKNQTANHLSKQVSAFHLGDKLAAKRADDLLDCYMYGLILAFGDGDAL